MGREFELKYRANPAVLEVIQGDFPGFHTITMETTYYDTMDGILGRLHWTVRRRLENGVSVCTVKTNLPDGSRGEWEVEADEIEEALPRLVSMGAPEALLAYSAQGLRPTCGARFTRNAAMVNGGRSELALDSGVLLGGGKEEPLCEVEVEQKQGTDEETACFAKALAEKYGLVPQPKSKLARARALIPNSK